MAINLIQVFAIVFSVFAWSRAMLRFKDKKITFNELILWSVIWIAVLVIALIPGWTFDVANALGIKRGIDVAVYSSIMLLLYLIFRLYVKIETLQHETTKLVREIAINKAKK
jgi:hypothetical protein